MVYILSSDPARTIMVGRRRQSGSGRRRQRGSGRRRQRGRGRRRQRGDGVFDVIKTVGSKLLPFAKQVGKYALKQGLKKAPGYVFSRNKQAYVKNAIKDTALGGLKHFAGNLARGPDRKARVPRRRRHRVVGIKARK